MAIGAHNMLIETNVDRYKPIPALTAWVKSMIAQVGTAEDWHLKASPQQRMRANVKHPFIPAVKKMPET